MWCVPRCGEGLSWGSYKDIMWCTYIDPRGGKDLWGLGGDEVGDGV